MFNIIFTIERRPTLARFMLHSTPCILMLSHPSSLSSTVPIAALQTSHQTHSFKIKQSTPFRFMYSPLTSLLHSSLPVTQSFIAFHSLVSCPVDSSDFDSVSNLLFIF